MKNDIPYQFHIAITAVVCLIVWYNVDRLRNPSMVRIISGDSQSFDEAETLDAGEIMSRYNAKMLIVAKRDRESFPVSPLESRLGYEDRKRSTRQPQTTLSPRAMSSLTEIEKADAEIISYRVGYLRYLHETTTDEFVAANGFGVFRSIINDELVITLPTLSAETVDLQDFMPQTAQARVAFRPDAERLHDTILSGFARPNSFGYVPAYRMAAGFVPHHVAEFSREDHPAVSTGPAKWRLIRVELVSLLKFDEPRVYASDSLPRLDQLAEAVTRTLSDFEKNSLEQLWSARDIVVADRDDEEIHALGAIRARSDCLQCHHVERGELLGAFSYHLKRVASDSLQ